MQIDGVININKPKGKTSHDVISSLRRRLKIKRIGHTGTLDPMATGVLPVCIGNCTRMIEYYDYDFKSYHAGVQLGITTDTLDITGTVLQKASFQDVTMEKLLDASKAFSGRVSQIPPKYSALKINGKRAYELAREGKEVDLKAREITIKNFEFTKIDLEKGYLEFDVVCSKGTYIRTICDDLGNSLGCGACMTSLVRTSSGYFNLSDATDLDELIEMEDDEIFSKVIPIDKTLTEIGEISLQPYRKKYFINGNSTRNDGYKIIVNKGGEFPKGDETLGNSANRPFKVYCEGEFLGIGSIDEENNLLTQKVYKK